MSTRTFKYKTRTDRDTLLELFLGNGNLQVTKGEETITVQRITNCYETDEATSEGVKTYNVEINGTSDQKNVTNVQGRGTLTIKNNACLFDLELEVETGFD